MTGATAAKKVPSFVRRRVDSTINIRVSKAWRDLIDNAASVLGKTRTDFIVESAQRHAIDVLLDQRFFSLEGDRYDAFIKALDDPPPPSDGLRRLMASKAPWRKP